MYTQIIINILFLTFIYILFSLSFNIIYENTKFFHFAHAVIFTSSAYFTFLFIQILGWSFFVAIPTAIISACLVGCMTEWFIYKPLRKKKSSSIILLLASLGIYIVLQNLISLFFGDDTKSIRNWEVKEGIEIAGAYVTPVQIIIIVTSLLLVVCCAAYLHYTKTGKAMRAVASDSELSKLSGIKSDRIVLISFAIGSALAGIAGILVALDVDMTPTMGMSMLLMGVVAMIVGGVGSIWGIVLGSLLLTTAQNLAVWYISSQWMDASAFVILLIFLLFKPEGFMGKKIRKANV
ncbi:MAG: branched-chain amino acid ABC transporter permease [Ignavibacteriales bacterium]|nr:MAG: branched-chain amino acid ABC transporter permease [Ignavibacteriales bacterium]